MHDHIENENISQTEKREEPFFSPVSHSYNEGIAIATKSIAAATIFNHIIFWLRINKAKGVNQIDGRTWMYQAVPEMIAHFPFLSEQQIRDGISLLIKHNYLLKGNFSQNKFDKTSWYSVFNQDWIGIQKSFPMRSTDQIEAVPRPDRGSLQTSSTLYTDNKKEIYKNIAQSPAALRSPPSEISFSFDQREFTGISAKDLQAWKELYPNLDIAIELKAMVEWILSNPSKAKSKKLWRKFITGWLQRQNEKITNQMAYKKTKSKNVLAKHTGFQNDHRVAGPNMRLDFSKWKEGDPVDDDMIKAFFEDHNQCT